MNKQIIAFLSLFSLVLVLSVYYVLVPTSNKAVEVNIGYEATRNAFFTSMTIQKESKQLEYINAQSLVIVSSDASAEEKALASVNIENTRATMQLEQEVAGLIKQEGFNAAYVQVGLDKSTIIISKNGDITNADYVKIFNITIEQKIHNPVIYNYDSAPSSLISD